ncbi:MAG: hypothetical protein WKG00_38020 [Polyangiaceae bacterium]
MKVAKLVAAAFASALACASAGCEGRATVSGDQRTPATSVGPATPASAAGTSAASSGPAGAGAAPDVLAPGDGPGRFDAVSAVPACADKTGEIATFLKRGELSIAAREGAVAAAWLLELPNTPAAQVAFAGFDAEGRQLARARGIGASRDYPPRVFATGDVWTVVWFDAEGLAHARPRWETLPAPDVTHLSALGKDVSEDVALARAPSGSLVVSAPFGPDRAQLSLFLFAPLDAGEAPARALAVTKHARQPRRPAVAAHEGGYYLAWFEEGGRIAASHFDDSGKESETAATVVAAGEAAREGLALAATPTGAIAVWQEAGVVRARALDTSARPTGPLTTVGKGRWAQLLALPATAGEASGAAPDGGAATSDAGAAPAGAAAVLVAWVGNDGKADDQLLVAALDVAAVPASAGLRVSSGSLPLKDPPSVSPMGTRLAFAWTEVMSVGVASKRAVLRTIAAGCVPR